MSDCFKLFNMVIIPMLMSIGCQRGRDSLIILLAFVSPSIRGHLYCEIAASQPNTKQEQNNSEVELKPRRRGND